MNNRMFSSLGRRMSFIAMSVLVAGWGLVHGQQPPATAQPGINAMSNPYRMVSDWPTLPPSVKWGAAIGIVPDGKGGTWVLHRANPPIMKIDQSGKVVKSFGDGMFTQAHGFCMDHDGNLWAGDSGPFRETPESRGKGFVVYKFSQDGTLLMTLGQAGISKAAADAFVGPTACAIAPNGDIMIADGHWPRPSTAAQDGDRIVQYTKEGKFVRAYGRHGSKPGEFMGPHALAFDGEGRLFVADRSNNRVQIFDKDMNFVDAWPQFGRPSGIAILKDGTLVVADSESGKKIAGPPDAPEGEGIRNPGWKNGIRVGSTKDGSLKWFVDGTDPEGLAADDVGNIFAGLTSRPTLQKWVRK